MSKEAGRWKKAVRMKRIAMLKKVVICNHTNHHQIRQTTFKQTQRPEKKQRKSSATQQWASSFMIGTYVKEVEKHSNKKVQVKTEQRTRQPEAFCF